MFSFLSRNKCLNERLINYGKMQLTSRMLRTTVRLRSTNEYQYIQISKTPTMHFQPSMPRLPIPKLENTCQRYLNAQKPLLSTEQLQRTTSYVKEFLGTEGLNLQKQLVEKDSKNRHTSYITEPWFDMYLSDRKPLPINYNPLLVFAQESDSRYNAQLVKATNLVISSLRFMKSLRENVLAPEVFHLNPSKSDTDLFRTVTRLLPPQLSWYGAYLFKAYPLDMSQYHNLFNTTRIPEHGKDKIYQDTSARHLVVMRKGHFYCFDVLDENGYIYDAETIGSCLKSILEDNDPANTSPVGVLTTAERDQWAGIRSHLCNIGNQDVLRKIDSAAFVMILDDEIVDTDYNKLLQTYLHSDGTNRWFDKSFSLIVSKDGYAGVNFEHSWGDGVAVLRFFNDVKGDISKNPQFHPDQVDCLERKTGDVQKLQFVVDEKAQSSIDSEKSKYEKWTKELCIDHIIYEGFGKDECKMFRVSPDAVMQLAFQLALYIQEGRVVPTYESCSTAAFKHGRTETIRSCTMQTKATCAALTKNNSQISTSELKKMIIDCSNAHNVLTKEAAMGQGFDRHLFALKKTWEQSNSCNSPKPAIFDDPAYENINANVLSTSTLSSPAVIAGGFGPVIREGYGIGYMIQNKRLGAIVTSYKDCRNANEYVKYLEEAFQRIRKVLAHA